MKYKKQAFYNDELIIDNITIVTNNYPPTITFDKIKNSKVIYLNFTINSTDPYSLSVKEGNNKHTFPDPKNKKEKNKYFIEFIINKGSSVVKAIWSHAITVNKNSMGIDEAKGKKIGIANEQLNTLVQIIDKMIKNQNIDNQYWKQLVINFTNKLSTDIIENPNLLLRKEEITNAIIDLIKDDLSEDKKIEEIIVNKTDEIRNNILKNLINFNEDDKNIEKIKEKIQKKIDIDNIKNGVFDDFINAILSNTESLKDQVKKKIINNLSFINLFNQLLFDELLVYLKNNIQTFIQNEIVNNQNLRSLLDDILFKAIQDIDINNNTFENKLDEKKKEIINEKLPKIQKDIQDNLLKEINKDEIQKNILQKAIDGIIQFNNEELFTNYFKKNSNSKNTFIEWITKSIDSNEIINSINENKEKYKKIFDPIKQEIIKFLFSSKEKMNFFSLLDQNFISNIKENIIKQIADTINMSELKELTENKMTDFLSSIIKPEQIVNIFIKMTIKYFQKLENELESHVNDILNNIIRLIDNFKDDNTKDQFIREMIVFCLFFNKVKYEDYKEYFENELIEIFYIFLENRLDLKDPTKMLETFIIKKAFPFAEKNIKDPDVNSKILKTFNINKIEIAVGKTTFMRELHKEMAKDSNRSYPREVILKVNEEGYIIEWSKKIIRKAGVTVNYR